jgi:uncharacterized protein with GYD domain
MYFSRIFTVIKVKHIPRKSYYYCGDNMPLFVVLGKWTKKRMETIKDLPENVKAGRKVFESYGVKFHNMVFTLGQYDLVAIGEAPSAEVMTKALLNWGSEGLLRTETLTAFTPQEMSSLVQDL